MKADLLFRHYYRELCLYALHFLADVDAAEDAVQDCFVRLVESGAEPQNARAWLYAAVRNRCIDQLRRAQGRGAQAPLSPPRRGETGLPDGIIPPLGGTEGGLDALDVEPEQTEREARLWEAIDQLPKGQRRVLLMAKRDGMTYTQIAQELGISPRTVEHQLSSALSKLRLALR